MSKGFDMLRDYIEHDALAMRRRKCCEFEYELQQEFAQLKAENAELREEVEQWHKLTANIELPEYPMCVFQPKDLERENAELRESIRQLFAQRDERLAVAERENAELRELVRDMLTEMLDYELIGCCRYERRARELGIEEKE